MDIQFKPQDQGKQHLDAPGEDLEPKVKDLAAEGAVKSSCDEGLKAARLLGVEEQMKQVVLDTNGRTGPGGTFVRGALDYRLME